MAILSGYFNSVSGDRKYNAETMSSYFSGIISRGVLQNWKNGFRVTSGGGLTVNVLPGRAYFTDGRWIENTAGELITLDAASVTQNRIDRIVLRKDSTESARSCSIVLKKGTPATSPTAPTLESSDTVEELCLASIYISANSTVITQANITDNRPNDSLCGFVHNVVTDISTEELFAQYQALFDEWFGSVRETYVAATLIRQYTSQYTTVSDNQTEIPINISVYNSIVDILNVYVNGLRLIHGTDYTINGSNIILVEGLEAGHLVNFEVFKAIEGSEAETVVNLVYDLQNRVAALEAQLTQS